MECFSRNSSSVVEHCYWLLVESPHSVLFSQRLSLNLLCLQNTKKYGLKTYSSSIKVPINLNVNKERFLSPYTDSRNQWKIFVHAGVYSWPNSIRFKIVVLVIRISWVKKHISVRPKLFIHPSLCQKSKPTRDCWQLKPQLPEFVSLPSIISLPFFYCPFSTILYQICVHFYGQ